MRILLISLFQVFIGMLIPTESTDAQSWKSQLGTVAKPLQDGTGFQVDDFKGFRETILKKLHPNLGTLNLNDIDLGIRDSLNKILDGTGILKLRKDSLDILRHLQLEGKDIQYLANLIFSVNRMGATKSLNYEVKKGDTINFSYIIEKGAGFDELEVLEGKELRFNFTKNKKNQEQTGEFMAAADGVITFNMTNRGLLRSRGKLTVSRKELQKKLAFVYHCDTTSTVIKEIKKVQDTLGEVITQQRFSIPSKMNITRSNKLMLPIALPVDKTPIAIGFWMGSKGQTIEKWQKLTESSGQNSPLLLYMQQEIQRKGLFILPEESAADIRFVLKDNKGWELRDAAGFCPKTSYSSPSLNYKKNFACFLFRENASFPDQLFLEIENRSTLYEYQTEFQVVGLFLNRYDAEVATTITSCTEYVTIKTI